MTSFTVTYTLNEAQAARLASLTALWNERTSTDHTQAAVFETIMLTGSGHAIDDRLEQTERLLNIDKS